MTQMKSEIRDGMRIDWDAPIEMDDGVVLRADVFRPVAEGKYPVILSYGPYAKGLAFQEGYKSAWVRMTTAYPETAAGSSNKYQNWELVDPEKWVPDGYAIVRVDSRGAGRSPGYLEVWSPREAKDLYECVEWAGTQPWSNGKVGINGISYYAMNQWDVAPLRPPHLAALCIWEGSADYYRELCRHGGILCDFLADWSRRQVTSVQHGVGERGPKSPVTGEPAAGPATLPEEALAQEPRRRRRRGVAAPADRRLLPRAHPAVRADRRADPLGRELGRPGPASAGQFRGLSRRRLQAEVARSARRHAFLSLLHELRRRITATLLRPLPQGRGYRLGQAAEGRAQYPPAGREVHPARRERMAADAHAVDQVLPERRGSQPGPGAAETATTLAYQTTGDGLTFLTPPMTEELEITGPVAAKLFVSSDTTDADLFLVLRLFDPQGKEVVFIGSNDPRTPIGLGWLRASHRKLDTQRTLPYRPWHTHDEEWPLTPGEPVELDIEIWPTCIVVPPGYRIGLSVRGKDYEYDGTDAALPHAAYPMKGVGPFTHTDPRDRPPGIFGGTNTLHFGADRAPYLLLPIIPPR